MPCVEAHPCCADRDRTSRAQRALQARIETVARCCSVHEGETEKLTGNLNAIDCAKEFLRIYTFRFLINLCILCTGRTIEGFELAENCAESQKMWHFQNKYRIALIFRWSKFSRIAALKEFVE